MDKQPKKGENQRSPLTDEQEKASAMVALAAATAAEEDEEAINSAATAEETEPIDKLTASTPPERSSASSEYSEESTSSPLTSNLCQMHKWDACAYISSQMAELVYIYRLPAKISTVTYEARDHAGKFIPASGWCIVKVGRAGVRVTPGNNSCSWASLQEPVGTLGNVRLSAVGCAISQRFPPATTSDIPKKRIERHSLASVTIPDLVSVMKEKGSKHWPDLCCMIYQVPEAFVKSTLGFSIQQSPDIRALHKNASELRLITTQTFRELRAEFLKGNLSEPGRDSCEKFLEIILRSRNFNCQYCPWNRKKHDFDSGVTGSLSKVAQLYVKLEEAEEDPEDNE